MFHRIVLFILSCQVERVNTQADLSILRAVGMSNAKQQDDIEGNKGSPDLHNGIL